MRGLAAYPVMRLLSLTSQHLKQYQQNSPNPIGRAMRSSEKIQFMLPARHLRINRLVVGRRRDQFPLDETQHQIAQADMVAVFAARPACGRAGECR